MRLSPVLAGSLFGLLALGCGDDSTSPSGAHAVAGTSVIFEPDADLSSAASFYDLPYPSDLRLTDGGGPDLTALPRPAGGVADTLIDAAMARPGFSEAPVGYFRFDGALPTLDEANIVAAEATAPVLLADVDPSSPDRGKLYPVVAHVHTADAFAPANLLTVSVYPGFVLQGGRKYAFVVKRALGDGAGELLGVPKALVELESGATPKGTRGKALASLYEPLWETLDTLGIERRDVAAATVFTVGDPIAETLELSDEVLAGFHPTIDGLALDPDDGATQPRFCEVHGSITYPEFQKGTPPFDTEGRLVFGADGKLVKQRDEVAPIALTIPKGPMPAGGYPLVVYIHGSGGLSTQLVDRGKITVPGGVEVKGEGPAFVLAAHGFAAAGSAMPLNPERLPGASPYAYINYGNLGAFASTFRQGVFEQRMFIRALKDLTIEPSVIAGCTGPTLPSGETAYRFNTDHLILMGQSMGGQYTNLTTAVEPLVKAAIPTGAGGMWSQFMTASPLFGGVKNVAGSLLEVDPDNLTYLHPALNLLYTAWEPGDAIAAVPHIGLRPFEGHPARSFYEPVAKDDEFFPMVTYNAMAMAYGSEEAGDIVWSDMQDNLALVGKDGILSYAVSDNETSANGDPFTAVVVQWEGDGIADPHTVFSQRDEVKYQYGCFAETFMKTGKGVVPAPAPLGTPCPN
jgi:hypothetical protein